VDTLRPEDHPAVLAERAGAIENEIAVAAQETVLVVGLFANTYLVTALNPKGMMFFVAFLPQFINPSAGVGTSFGFLPRPCRHGHTQC
jgi:threonine/homoserine/homoserine lactone efflux protein